MNRGTLSVPAQRKTLLLTPNQSCPPCGDTFFLDLKLSSLSLHQLGDDAQLAWR